jgi:lipoprotein signal peptidase
LVSTGTSNLADVAIVIGIPLILIGCWPSKPAQPVINEQTPIIDTESQT